MPTPTGIWSQEESDTGHIFDYKLAQWLGQILNKDVTLIDMGCGPATYLRYFHDIGFNYLYGVEGAELKQSEFGRVIIQDLTVPFDLMETEVRQKGNVMCLEVAEHIPEQYESTFIDNLVNHLGADGKLILSWGIPGQGGLGHVNCKHNIDVIRILKNWDLKLSEYESLLGRCMVSNHAHWFRNTFMVFERMNSAIK